MSVEPADDNEACSHRTFQLKRNFKDFRLTFTMTILSWSHSLSFSRHRTRQRIKGNLFFLSSFSLFKRRRVEHGFELFDPLVCIHAFLYLNAARGKSAPSAFDSIKAMHLENERLWSMRFSFGC